MVAPDSRGAGRAIWERPAGLGTAVRPAPGRARAAISRSSGPAIEASDLAGGQAISRPPRVRRARAGRAQAGRARTRTPPSARARFADIRPRPGSRRRCTRRASSRSGTGCPRPVLPGRGHSPQSRRTPAGVPASGTSPMRLADQGRRGTDRANQAARPTNPGTPRSR